MQDEIQIDNISTSSDCHSIDGRLDISPQDAAAAEGSDILKEAKCADGEACEGSKGEMNKDTPIDENMPVYEQVGWKDKVQRFLRDYPIAKNFAEQIGMEIANDKGLSLDASCLEKALAITLAKEYVAPDKLAEDEDFLQKYILCNESIKDRIIDGYFESLQQNLPPRSISSRGHMTITPPSKPKSIAEAGSVIRAMLNNRRI